MTNPSARSRILWLAAIVFGLLGFGYLAFEHFYPLAEITETTIRENIHSGSPREMLEWTFWLNCLIASILSFREMDLLFRAPGIRRIQSYAISDDALFADRFTAVALEAALTGLGLLLFFTPIWVHFSIESSIVISTFVLLGPIVSGLIAGMSHVVSGAQIFVNSRSRETNSSRSHQLFLYAPGVGLGAAVIILLILKLTAGEVIKTSSGEARFVTVFLVIVGGTLVSSLLVGHHYFKKTYTKLVAIFRELDALIFDSLIDHYRSQSKIADRSLSKLDLVLQAVGLQFERKHRNARILYIIASIGAGLAVGRVTDPSPLMTMLIPLLPLGICFFMANYWQKLPALVGEHSFEKSLPIRRSDLDVGLGIYALKEAMVLSMLFAASYGATAYLSGQMATADILVAASAAIGSVAFGELGVFAHIYGKKYRIESVYFAKAVLVAVIVLLSFISQIILGICSLAASAILIARLWSQYKRDIQGDPR